MSLKDALQEIRGIGESKADEIMTVFEDYQQEQGEDYPPEVVEALDYLESGNPEYAKKFLRRVVDE